MFKKSTAALSFSSILTLGLFAAAFLLVPLTANCSAVVRTMSDDDALKTLRDLTRDGKLPPEAVVADIENRFAKTRSGALAKLLRARIRFEGGDFAGAAQILDAAVFKERTKLADYALWLRGRALQSAGRHGEAMSAFAELARAYLDSLRAREAKLLWAGAAIAAGQAAQVPPFLDELADKNQPDALLLTAKALEASGNASESLKFYRRAYFFGAGTDAAKEAEAKLAALGQSTTAQTAEEATARAERLYAAKSYAEANKAFNELAASFPAAATAGVQLKRLIALVNLKNMAEAQNAFDAIPAGAPEKEEAFYNLTVGYAKSRLWSQARAAVQDMRERFPAGRLTPKAWVDAGMAARDAKAKAEETYFLRSALAGYPNAVEVAGAQFELAWLEHESGNFAASSQMLVEHLARYVDKDSTNRGKVGYWSARDSERAGKTAEACTLYDAVAYRYGANWYGHLALDRLTRLRAQNKCQSTPQFPAGSLVPKAAANLKIVTVAPETAGARELARAEKSEELSVVGLFDWAVDELKEAQKTAAGSPKINLALAKHFRLKGDNVSALLALAKSYPDYAQMFPEEMGREEWDIFYPLINWKDIKYWAGQRNLDPYKVAGLIRQESVFNPRARSSANAYGLMQLLVPTARMMAKKYGAAGAVDAGTLFNPALNIELGTAYMRDQLDKYGRVEYMAVAYNAGPGRVTQWARTLPLEIDEYVERIPFRETKGYVQGVVRNMAQYRRLYDENGNFKPNVGARPLRAELDARSREQIAQELPEAAIDDGANE